MNTGYAFCCPVVGMYRCKRPDCRCVENWNAERASELATPERQLIARARHYLSENAAESGADVLIAELADTLEARLPAVELATPERQLIARARHYLSENAAESGADVLIAELADTLEARLPAVRQEAVQ